MLFDNIYNLKFKLRKIIKGFRLKRLKPFFKYLDAHKDIKHTLLNGGLVVNVFKSGGRHILCDVYTKDHPPTT
jgi:hypothetical protein